MECKDLNHLNHYNDKVNRFGYIWRDRYAEIESIEMFIPQTTIC